MAFFILLLSLVGANRVELTFDKPLPASASTRLRALLGQPDMTYPPLGFDELLVISEAWVWNRHIQIDACVPASGKSDGIKMLSLYLVADRAEFGFPRPPAPP